MINIESYNELNMFDFKNQFRNELQDIINPYIKQCADDRSYYFKVERQLRLCETRLNQLENIIYQREDLEGMDLFKKIFDKIKTVDSERLVEEQKLRTMCQEN